MVDQRASKFLRERSPVEEPVRDAADYYLLARASRDHGKATFDLLFEEDGDL